MRNSIAKSIKQCSQSPNKGPWIRYHQFARGLSFTIGDGDFDVSRGVEKVAEISSVNWQNDTDTDSKKELGMNSLKNPITA